MIREALAASPSNRLTIASIGAATNFASALKLEPRIIPNVRCYLMAAHYDAATGIWNKDEFNVRHDLNAFNYLLNLDGLDLHIMPATVCRRLVFQRKPTMERLAKLGSLGGILSARWTSHAPEAESWIMWDLALMQALARPELAKEARFRTPPENKPREVWVYTDINAPEMERDFWQVLEKR